MNKNILMAVATVTLAATGAHAVNYADMIISEAPEGRVVKYARDAGYFYSGNGGVYFGQDTSFATEVVFTDNEAGDVYIKNPVSGFQTNTYIKGQLKDGVITCKFPQVVMYDSMSGYAYCVNRLAYQPVYDADGNYVGPNYVTVDKLNQMTWTYDETTGEIVQERENNGLSGKLPAELMGITVLLSEYEEAWYPSGDCNQIYYEFKDEVTRLPEGVEPSKMACKYWLQMKKWNSDVVLLNLAFDGNDVYLGNLYKGSIKENYIKGKLEGDKITFPSRQYIGLNEATNHYAYFMGATAEFIQYPGDSFTTATLNREEQLVFNYDAERGELSADGIMVVNNGYLQMSDIYIYVEPYIYPTKFDGYAEPRTPRWDSVSYMEDPSLGLTGMLLFTVPKYDLNDLPLDTDRMFYCIWTDGEPLTLYPDEYPGLETEIRDIPYDFDNNYNVRVNGELHQLSFYFSDRPSSWTIQSFFEDENGNIYQSAVADTAGISDIVDATPVEASYYDLSGRRVYNPGSGMYVKMMRYSDGSVRSSKVMLNK